MTPEEIKAAEEAAAKKAADEAAAKKAADEAAAKKVAEEAAVKKAADKTAAKKSTSEKADPKTQTVADGTSKYERLFAANKSLDVLYVTADGECFYTQNAANNHAATLGEGKKNVERKTNK